MNALLIGGSAPALVDPGPNTRAAREALRAALRERSLAVGDVRLVVVTHTHLDHCGLAAWVHAESGAPVICHESGVAALTQFTSVWPQRVALLRRVAEASGAPPGPVAEMLDIQVGRSGLSESVPRDAVRTVRDRQRMKAGGTTWSVLHTPGHARDHIALFHRPSGSLISGDLVLRHMPTPPWLEPRLADGARPRTLADLVSSWRRVGRLDVTIAWPGHGGDIRAHRILLAQRLAGARDHVLAARRALRRGESTLYSLATILGLETSPDGLPAALGAVVAIGDWLVDRGLATRRVADGIVLLGATPRDRGAHPAHPSAQR